MRTPSFARGRGASITCAALIAAVTALLPLFVTDVYTQNILVLTLMFAALSQSWNILSGYCGQISLGHALYFGLGAYVSTILFTKFGIIPWIGMVAGGALSASIALALGYPCFRLRGHYFTIATVVIAETGYLLFLNWDWVGAALGIQIPIRPRQLAPVPVSTRQDPVFLLRARSCVRDLVRDLDLRGFQVGLLVACGEGQSRGRREPRRRRVPFQDGRGCGVRALHLHCRQLLRAICRLHRSRERDDLSVLAADGAPGRPRRNRHVVGTGVGCCHTHPAQ